MTAALQFNTVYKDKLGNEIDSYELERLLKDGSYCIIKQDQVESYFISTEWVGIPWGCYYFETMIFIQSGRTYIEHECYRYETLEEAKLGHFKVVRAYKDKKCIIRD